MGTLKRFSYDNIVIHDPTAPDPVEGGGGSGGGNFIIHATPGGTAEEPTLSIDKSFDDIMTAVSDGYIPVIDVVFGQNHSIYYANSISPSLVSFDALTTFTTGSTWVEVSISEIVINPQNEINISNETFRISKVGQ